MIDPCGASCFLKMQLKFLNGKWFEMKEEGYKSWQMLLQRKNKLILFIFTMIVSTALNHSYDDSKKKCTEQLESCQY